MMSLRGLLVVSFLFSSLIHFPPSPSMSVSLYLSFCLSQSLKPIRCKCTVCIALFYSLYMSSQFTDKKHFLTKYFVPSLTSFKQSILYTKTQSCKMVKLAFRKKYVHLIMKWHDMRLSCFFCNVFILQSCQQLTSYFYCTANITYYLQYRFNWT